MEAREGNMNKKEEFRDNNRIKCSCVSVSQNIVKAETSNWTHRAIGSKTRQTSNWTDEQLEVRHWTLEVRRWTDKQFEVRHC